MVKNELPPPEMRMELILTRSSFRLKILKLLVTDPVVVNTVSNLSVSAEKVISASSLVFNRSLLQEGHRHPAQRSKKKTVISLSMAKTKIKLYCLLNRAGQCGHAQPDWSCPANGSSAGFECCTGCHYVIHQQYVSVK
jgi:hypothetical protein